MAGIAIILNQLKSSQSSSSSSSALFLQSHSLITASAAASAAAAYIAATRPFASRSIFGDGGIFVAHCDAGATTASYESYVLKLNSAVGVEKSTKFEYKVYPVELRPLFSAFHLRHLALTSLRSFLQYYLPLVEIFISREVDDDDVHLQDGTEQTHVDLLTPFHNSLKQIVRETSAVTIRRVLERLAVHYCSQRMAWKLLKDISKSARRKAKRDLPFYSFLFQISRTAFRGHVLGVVASWIVQNILVVYKYWFKKPDSSRENLNRAEKNRFFWKEVYSSTIKFTSSLIFASLGAGIGALFHPSIGQLIGSTLGDIAGPFIAVVIFERVHFII